MRIVVTGSSGRVGPFVVREFLEHGHQVVPVDVSPGSDPALPATIISDLSKVDELPAIFGDADAVCHLANVPGQRGRFSHSEIIEINTRSAFNVFEAATQVGIRKIIYASSIQAYGVVANGPSLPTHLALPQYLPIDESHPLLARYPYPMSKVIGEQIAQSFVRRNPALQVFAVRLAMVRDSSRPAKKYPAVLAKEGFSLFAGTLFTYVDAADAAELFLRCVDIDRPGFTALNAVDAHSCGQWTIDLLQEQYGAVPPFTRPLTADDSLICGRAAEQILGWRPNSSARRPFQIA